MTIQEIKDKYLFKFDNPGNGIVLTCGFAIEEKTMSYRRYSLHFLSCTSDPEEWDFVDNVFRSKDKIEWEFNGSISEEIKVYDDIHVEFIKNFIRRLFNKDDRFIEIVLNGV